MFSLLNCYFTKIFDSKRQLKLQISYLIHDRSKLRQLKLQISYLIHDRSKLRDCLTLKFFNPDRDLMWVEN